MDGQSDTPPMPLHRRDDVPTPPAKLRTGGKQFLLDENFLRVAREHCSELGSHVQLAARRILDFGCGVGRLYYGFTTADEPELYVGADIRRDAIDWAATNISPANPRFRFVWSDIGNARYNAKGGLTVDAWRQALDGPFDVIYANSVLSHMTEADAEATLALFADVLAPDGALFVTAFVDDALKGFNVNPPGWGTLEDSPLHAVVYETALFESLLRPAFTIVKRQRLGRFRQTIYILRRR